ncbi:hypothetical protein SBA3_2900009 [Candidatus Sulfopaludibacter sp. SbA3]|nr:hypothetical protein SBA3_2900009 [Candidatus Sulfopaludibacter sp. SbA3]
MLFVPIALEDYVRKHMKANPGSNEREETKLLRHALARYKAGGPMRLWRGHLGDRLGTSGEYLLHLLHRRGRPFGRLRDRRSLRQATRAAQTEGLCGTGLGTRRP